MPKIGCGLDGLQWHAVKTLLKNVFQTTDIKLTVYVLEDQDEGKPNDDKTKKILNFFQPTDPEKKVNEVEKNPKDLERRQSIGFGYMTKHPLPDVLLGFKINLSKVRFVLSYNM